MLLFLPQEQENKARAEKGEARLPDEDLNKLFKPPAVPPRLDGLLSSGQMKIYCTEINKLASQTFGKLFLADSLQSNPSLSWESERRPDMEDAPTLEVTDRNSGKNGSPAFVATEKRGKYKK